MSEDVCFLITVLNEDRLLRCALKVKRDSLSGDVIDYPMEPENREQLYKLLPLHVQSCGPIVDVEGIFEVAHTREKKG